MINVRLLYYIFKILDLASNSVIRIISLTQWKIISNPQPPSSNPLPWKGEIIGDAKIPQNQDCKLKFEIHIKTYFPLLVVCLKYLLILASRILEIKLDHFSGLPKRQKQKKDKRVWRKICRKERRKGKQDFKRKIITTKKIWRILRMKKLDCKYWSYECEYWIWKHQLLILRINNK